MVKSKHVDRINRPLYILRFLTIQRDGSEEAIEVFSCLVFMYLLMQTALYLEISHTIPRDGSEVGHCVFLFCLVFISIFDLHFYLNVDCPIS